MPLLEYSVCSVRKKRKSMFGAFKEYKFCFAGRKIRFIRHDIRAVTDCEA